MPPRDNLISDGIIKWVPYSREEQICSHYSLDDWHKAVHDIDSDTEWAEFLEESDFVKCYVLKNCKTDSSIAFLYTIQEDFEGKILSVHGGGWENPILYYRGYVLMLKSLLEQDYKVRTYCQLNNLAAIRFSRSVGFVPYRYSIDEVFMWISTRTLMNSKLYKRFYM